MDDEEKKILTSDTFEINEILSTSDDHILAEPKEYQPKVSGEHPGGQVALKRPESAARSERLMNDESAVSKFKDYLTDYSSDRMAKSAGKYSAKVNAGKSVLLKQNRGRNFFKKSNSGQTTIPNPLDPRKDPNKTKRVMEENKINKIKEDIAKKLESGLIPPGMEMEDSSENQLIELSRLPASPLRDSNDSSNIPEKHCSSAMGDYVLVDRTSVSPEVMHRDNFPNRNYSRSIHSQDKFFAEDESLLKQLEKRLSDDRYSSRDTQFDRRRSHSRDVKKHHSNDRFASRDPQFYHRSHSRDEAFKRHSFDHFSSRDQQLHHKRRLSRERTKPLRYSRSPSYSSDRRVDVKDQLVRSKRRGLPRSREISPGRHPKEMRLSNEKYSKERERRFSREGSIMRRHRVVNSPKRHPSEKRIARKHLSPKMSRNSRNRSNSREQISNRRHIGIRQKTNTSELEYSPKNDLYDPFNRSLSLEKLPATDELFFDSNFKNDVNAEYPVVTDVPSAPSYQYPSQHLYTFEQLPPVFKMNAPNMIPYNNPSVANIAYEDPLPMYNMPTSQHSFSAPPPPHIGMLEHATSVSVDHFSNSFQRMPFNNQVHSVTTTAGNFQQTASQPSAYQQVSMQKGAGNNVAAEHVTGQHIANYNSQSQSLVLPNKMPLKERLHLEDIIKRCQIAIQKLDYLHLPNRIYLPLPKKENNIQLRYASPLVREQVTYDFTSKSSNEKSFLVASIFSTLDIDIEDVVSEPSVTISKFRNVAVQTDSISCDVCMFKNSKISKSLCKSTMTDVQHLKIPMVPKVNESNLPPAPSAPVSLMYLTAAKILDPEYNPPKHSMENSSMASKRPMDVSTMASRNCPPEKKGIGRGGYHQPMINRGQLPMNMQQIPRKMNFPSQMQHQNMNSHYHIQKHSRQKYKTFQNISFDATQRDVFPFQSSRHEQPFE